MKLDSHKLPPVIIAACVLAVVCLLHFLPHILPKLDLFDRIEWITYDWRVRQAAKLNPAKTTDLGLVFISDDSIGAVADGTLGYQYGLYWPRHIYGRVVRELEAESAKAVGFDVLFGELRPDHADTELPDKTKISSDEFFGLQIKKGRNVILAASRGVIPPSLFKTNAYLLGHIDADSDSDSVLRRAKAFQNYRDWHELIHQFAHANGVNLSEAKVEKGLITFKLSDGKPFTIKTDEKGRFDLYDLMEKPSASTPPLLEEAFVDRRVWHMGIVLAAIEMGLDLEKPEIDLPHGKITLHNASGVTRRIPVDKDGYLLIDWSIPIEDKALAKQSIEGLLENDNLRMDGKGSMITNSMWKDKLVIIGSTASGNDLSDTGGTPLEKKTYLISKHWNVANSVLNDRFITQTNSGVDALVILLLVVGTSIGTVKLKAPWSTVVMIAAGGAYVAIAHHLFVANRLWIPMVLPALGGIGLTHVATVIYQVVFEQKEKRKVKDVFNKLVSPNVVHELLGAEKLNLGGSRRNITVFFADVRGFTQMTDVNQANAEAYVREHHLVGDVAEAYFDQSAQETLSTVNTYLATIADQIKSHNGTLDKYIGDCVMAFWGAPTPNEKHAVSCVRAAMDAQRAMYKLNQDRQAENARREEENILRAAKGEPLLHMLSLLSLGTGINTGVCIVGLMGSDAHILNYTVFGREVNLASRLEGVSGRGRVIIGDTTYKELLIHDAELAATCVELPPVQVKGITQAVKIYEVPWKQGLENPASATQVFTKDKAEAKPEPIKPS